MSYLNKLVTKGLMLGFPKIKCEPDRLCGECQKGKQIKTSFKHKQDISTSRPLELIHMDLFGP